MPATMCRVPAPIVQGGSMGSVIQNRGMLVPAHRASDGFYLFSERGAGVKPLALIGMWHEVLNFLETNGASGIRNRNDTLPEIYFGASFYTPGQQFKGLWPVQDIVTSFAKKVTGVLGDTVGGGINTKIGGGSKLGSQGMTLMGALGDGWKWLTGGAPVPTLSSSQIYLKFTYLPEPACGQIGSGTMTFREIAPVVKAKLESMV